MGTHGNTRRQAGCSTAAAAVSLLGNVGAPAAASEPSTAMSLPTYGVMVLPNPPDTLPGFVGTGLNEFGHVSGWADSPTRAFVFRDGGLTELRDLTVEPTIAHDINIEGQSDADNDDVVGFRLVPPDTNGDVGANHYVQRINLILAVYDMTGFQTGTSPLCTLGQ